MTQPSNLFQPPPYEADLMGFSADSVVGAPKLYDSTNAEAPTSKKMSQRWFGWIQQNLMKKFYYSAGTLTAVNIGGIPLTGQPFNYVLSGDLVYLYIGNIGPLIKVGGAALAIGGLPAAIVPADSTDGFQYRCYGLISNNIGQQPGLGVWSKATKQFTFGVDVVTAGVIQCGTGGFPAGFFSGWANFGMIYRLR